MRDKRMRPLITSFYFLFIIIARPGPFAFGQSKAIDFERLSIADGLSQSSVNCILQDRQGFMWFGTEDGLNKYDGYTFTVYRHDPYVTYSLSNNYVLSMMEAADGSIWIGTRGGLNKFNRTEEKFTRYPIPETPRQSFNSDYVWTIHEDAGGELWIGTDGGGLAAFDRKAGKFTRYNSQADDFQGLGAHPVLAIFEDAEGILWIGTDGGGLNKFDRTSGKITRYQTQAGNAHGISDNTVRSICANAGGGLWVGTGMGGLNKFDPKTERFSCYQNQATDPHSLSNNSVNSVFSDRSGKLWVGTRGGLHQFDGRDETFTRYQHRENERQSISSNNILSIFEDAGGILWVGTQGGGLNKFDGKGREFVHYHNQPDDPKSLSHNFVRSIYEDSGCTLWIGTQGGGLNRFDRTTKTFRHYLDPLGSTTVFAVFEDRAGTMWIGTSDGLFKTGRKKDVFTGYHNRADNPKSLSHNIVRCVYEDSGGTLWIGTQGGGLNRFDRTTETFTRYLHQSENPQGPGNTVVFSIIEDRAGILWVGTSGGLIEFDRKEKTWICHNNLAGDTASISDNTVASIYEDSRNILWIGTRGGLNRYDRRNKVFSHYREKDGLPNDVIYGILEDRQGRLWLSTNKGISRFNPETETFTNYDERDGLQSDEFNAGAFHQGRSGRMYFGGLNGFNEFVPDQVKDNAYVPPVVITKLLLFNQPVSVHDRTVLRQDIGATKEIVFKHTDYIFAFEFSALNYRQSEKNRFSYRLEGFDKDWIDTDHKHRRATYTNLPPGEYQFRVKASNDDGCWNEEGASMKITVLPPFWKTWWFRALLALAMISLVVFVYWLRTRSMRVRNEELSELNKQLDSSNRKLAVSNQDLNRAISELKQTNQKLEASEEKYRNLIQQSNDAIYLLYDKKFEVINDKFQQIFGLTLEEVNCPDFDFMDLVAPKSKAFVAEKSRRMEAGEDVESVYEFTALAKDGKELDAEVSTSHIKYKNGIATQGILKDITQRKKLEQQLIQTQKMEAIGTLAGGIAHDFNNLLTVISGYAEMALAKTGDNHDVKQNLLTICSASKKAETLTSQILAFSRKQIFQPMILDVNMVISELDKMMRRLIGEDINIEKRLVLHLPGIKADPSQIEQIIINLIVNARDAVNTRTDKASEKKITIETGTSHLDESYVAHHPGSQTGLHVFLAVSDNGCGMTEEIKQKAFEPFFTTKKKGKGTAWDWPPCMELSGKTRAIFLFTANWAKER